MADNELAPFCDVLRTFFLETVDPVTFKTIPDVDSTLSGWLGLTKESAEPPDPALVATIAHVGVETPDADHPYPLGTWGVEIDATLLTAERVALFTSGHAYLIVQSIGGVRKYEKLKVVTASAAELV
jgi:hypothetical protein